jgi:hypothetical protein
VLLIVGAPWQPLSACGKRAQKVAVRRSVKASVFGNFRGSVASLGLKRSGLCFGREKLKFIASWVSKGFWAPQDRYRRLVYKINSFSLNSPLKGQNGFRATFGQLHDPAGDGFHDFFVFVSILKLVVNIGNAALAMVLDSVHGVAAKT